MSGTYIHTECGSDLVRKSNMFYWRGRTFHGPVCEKCKSLWSDPDDSFCAHIGIPELANGVEVKRG